MAYKPSERQARCRHCNIYCGPGQDESHCCLSDPGVSVDAAACESCESYESAYIEFPLTVTGIDNERLMWRRGFHEPLSPVAVRPCDDECAGRTYLGVYLGEFPAEVCTSWSRSTGVLSNTAVGNPAIYVPELGRVVWGYESWWREVKDLSEIPDITDRDIESCWYMRAFASLDREGDGR